MSQRRYLHRVAAETFATEWEDVHCKCVAFTTEELRREAAFHCWLQELDLQQPPPHTLPGNSTLDHLAAQFDDAYGELDWWDWGIWSSCRMCARTSCISCNECIKYAKFCLLSDEWITRQQELEDNDEPMQTLPSTFAENGAEPQPNPASDADAEIELSRNVDTNMAPLILKRTRRS